MNSHAGVDVVDTLHGSLYLRPRRDREQRLLDLRLVIARKELDSVVETYRGHLGDVPLAVALHSGRCLL